MIDPGRGCEPGAQAALWQIKETLAMAGKSTNRRVSKKPRQILSVDIGGSSVKILASGATEPRKMASGPELTPSDMVEQVKRLAHGWDYDAVSIGYPGLVGVAGPLAEPGNLASGWVGFDFASAFGCPVRLINDAAMQALGSYEGKRMLFIGLGTGLGSVLISEHVIVPLELGEMPYKKGMLWQVLGRRGLEKKGKKAWRKALAKVIPSLQRAFHADYVTLGGGNAKLLKKLPPNVRLGNNLTAFRGGFRLWGIDEVQTLDADSRDQPVAAAKTGDWRLV
jgi:polyphosphate glucokinase